MLERGIYPEVLEAVMKRRGKVRLFEHLDPKKLTLLVIDMENCFVAPGGAAYVGQAKNVVPNINRLADACRGFGIPVIWVVHANRADGSDWRLFFDSFLNPETREKTMQQLAPDSWGTQIWEGLEVREGDRIVNKRRYSALLQGSSDLEKVLAELGRDTLIITGTKTNICCEATARDAMMLNYKVLFIADATAALTEREHHATLNTIFQNFGDVLTTRELVQEIEGAYAPASSHRS